MMLKFIQNLPAGLTEESIPDLYLGAYLKSGYKIPITRVINTL